MRSLVVIALVAACSCKGDNVAGDVQGDLAMVRTKRASTLLATLERLNAIDVEHQAQRLASSAELIAALHASDHGDQANQAQLGFAKFVAGEFGTRADIIALVDATGAVVAMHDVATVVPKMWKGAPGPTTLPALDAALAGTPVSDLVELDGHVMRIGSAPVRDRDVIGAVVVAYPVTAKETAVTSRLLGSDVDYVSPAAWVSSFLDRAGGEDRAKGKELATMVRGSVVAGATFTSGTARYVVAPVEPGRASSSPLPTSYPKSVVRIAVAVEVRDELRTQPDERLIRAYQLVQRIDQLEALDLLDAAQELATRPAVVEGLDASDPTKTLAALQQTATRTHARVLVIDAAGAVLAVDQGAPNGVRWKGNPAVDTALARPIAISEVGPYADKLMRVAVASVVKPGNETAMGVVVIAREAEAADVQRLHDLLDVDVAYYDHKRIAIASLPKSDPLAAAIPDEPGPTRAPVSIDGKHYLVVAAKRVRVSTRPLSEDYPASSAGVLLLVPAREP